VEFLKNQSVCIFTHLTFGAFGKSHTTSIERLFAFCDCFDLADFAAADPRPELEEELEAEGDGTRALATPTIPISVPCHPLFGRRRSGRHRTGLRYPYGRPSHCEGSSESGTVGPCSSGDEEEEEEAEAEELEEPTLTPAAPVVVVVLLVVV